MDSSISSAIRLGLVLRLIPYCQFRKAQSLRCFPFVYEGVRSFVPSVVVPCLWADLSRREVLHHNVSLRTVSGTTLSSCDYSLLEVTRSIGASDVSSAFTRP